MSEANIQFIKEVLNIKINHYNGFLAENERIISDYNNEIKTSNDYNNRQILELLQNAEDAKATEVEIVLDKEQKKIVIRNNGEQFISKGIASLMISDNSPKAKWENIGNKGLGFRSVITWCDKVVIKSSGCIISFSRDIAIPFFKSKRIEELKKIESDTIILDELLQKNILINQAGLGWNDEEIKEYNKSHHKGNNVYFPLFGMPQIDIMDSPSEWVSIELYYKDNEKIEAQIEEQLSNKRLNEENLLFLRNIKKITVIGNNEPKKIIKSQSPLFTKINDNCIYECVTINNINWNVLKDKGPYEHIFDDIPEVKTVNYSAMIAWKQGENKRDYPLYCYFPTDILAPLPFIMHGTFELNSSRKQLVNEIEFDNNTFIFNKLGKLVEIAINIIKGEKEQSSWDVYEFIEHPPLLGDLTYLSKLLNDIKQTKEIYPSVYKNIYLTQNDYIYYTDSFSKFAEKYFPEEFRYMIKAGKEVDVHVYKELISDECKHGIIELISEIDTKIDSYELRATFIRVLSELEKVAPNWNYKHQFPLLINQQGQKIASNKIGYINKKNIANTINLPFYVKFELVNQKLSDLLYDYVNYSDALLKEPKRDDRALKNTLNTFINISEYDLARITEGVISQVKDAIKSGEDQKEVIKAETSFLFYEYYKSKDEEKLSAASSRYRPRFFNTNYEIESASKLYFSQDFGSIGKDTHDIWADSISSDELLLFSADNGIPLNSEEEINDAIEFYKYFGVNTFLTIKEVQISDGNFDQFTSDEITSSVERYLATKGKKITSGTRANISYIANINKIKSINDLTKILIIILKSEERIKKLICNDTQELFRGEYLTSTFINYQLNQLNKFNDSFAPKNTGILFKLLNKSPIDVEKIKKMTSKTYGDISQILFFLGCKTELSQYGCDFLYEFMNTFGALEELKNGRYVSTLYTEIVKALSSFDETIQKKSLNNHNMFYWINNNGSRQFLNVKENEIYYFENKELPDHFLKERNIICIPFRKGGEKVPTVLGIKGRRDWIIKIDENTIKDNKNELITSQFLKKLNRIRPLILKYRFTSDMSEDYREEQANKLNKFEIVFVKKLQYSINEKEDFLRDYEFIQFQQTFYFKIVNESSIEDLCKQKLFLDAFAEMLSMCFELTDDDLLDSFRLLVSYTDDELQKELDSNISLANDFEEYSKYFDISNTHEYIFWDAVLSFKGKNTKDFSCSTVNELNKSVMAYLDIPIECPNLYSINKDEHIELLRQIHNKTSIDITSLLKKVGKDIESYNTSKIENQVKLFEKQFLYKLWCKLVKNKTLQSNFVNYRDYYLNALFKDKIREELKYSLDFNAETELCNVIFNDPNFGFMLDSGIDNETIPTIRIRHFYKQYEEYINQPKNDYRFYFMGYKNDLEILKNKENENNGQNTNDEELDFEEEWGIASEKEIPESKNKKNGHGGSHSKRTEKEKLKKGTKAEEAIIKWFKKNNTIYGFNDKRGASESAGGHDSHHIDFEYWKKDDAKKVRYLEVKVSDDGIFKMSSDEFNFGTDEKNIDRYDLVLVSFDPENPKKVKLKFLGGFFKESKYTKKITEYEIAVSFIKKDK